MLMQSCSIQQRRYTGGFNIHWPSVGLSQRKISANVPHQKASNAEAGYRSMEEKSAASLSEKFTNPDTNRISQAPSSLAVSADISQNAHVYYENNTRIVPQAMGEKSTIRQLRTNAKSDPVEDILKIIGLILTIILGSSSFGGRISSSRRSGGRRGGLVDTTVFWVIASVVIAAAGIAAAIALKGVFKPSNYTNILILPFTLFGVPSGLIGLIKSIRDRYDVGKYLSIGAFAMLAIMWVIALI